MGGRVASPTFVGRIEELELLEAAGVRVGRNPTDAAELAVAAVKDQ